MANGWLQRAHTLLDGEPDCAEQAWLAVREGFLALVEDGDPDRALDLATRAMRIARDVAALNQAKQALDRDLDRGKQERTLLASMNRKVAKESDVTADARHDLHADRSALEHPSAKSHRK